MRLPIFALALLPALALAQPAPPTAADSALVERLLPALELETAQQALDAMSDQFDEVLAAESDDGPPPEWLAEAFSGLLTMDLAATTDSIRAAFLRDLRPGLIEEALVYLEGPTPDALLEQSRFQLDAFDLGEILALVADPEGEPLADSALAARYAAANTAASMPPEATEILIASALGALPPQLRKSMDQAFGSVGGLEAFFAAQQAEQVAAQEEMTTLAARLTLADVDEAVVREATAYLESPSGRYVMGTVATTQARLMAPAIGAMMRTMFEKMMAAPPPPRPRTGPPPPAPPPPPPPPPPARGEPEIYEVAEVQPKLMGGLEGLQGRVVYPELARRAGIEGQVVVQFVVDETGRVVDPVVLRSPDASLTEAALEAVRGSRFAPGRQRGRPVKVRFAVPITFRLTDPAPEVDDGQ